LAICKKVIIRQGQRNSVAGAEKEAEKRNQGGSVKPSLDLQKQRDKRVLAMSVRLLAKMDFN
jgi:hypothetical protein